MKISVGGGTPIFVSPRRYDGGVTVVQGTSRLGLRPAEISELIRALQVLMPTGQRVDEIDHKL